MEIHDGNNVCISIDSIICTTTTLTADHRIPVYIINATYLGPLAVWLYYQYGRPAKPVKGEKAQMSCHDASGPSTSQRQDSGHQSSKEDVESQMNGHADIDHSGHQSSGEHDHMHHHTGRPFWATVAIGVMHCGAG